MNWLNLPEEDENTTYYGIDRDHRQQLASDIWAIFEGLEWHEDTPKQIQKNKTKWDRIDVERLGYRDDM